MNRVEKWQEDLILKPLIFLFGLYIAALVLQALLGIQNDLFAPLFVAAGGVPGLGLYYKQKLNEG